MRHARLRLAAVLLSALALSAPAHVSTAAQAGAGKTAWKRFERAGEYTVLMPADPQPLTFRDGPGSEPDSFLARAAGAYYHVATIPHAAGARAASAAARERVFDRMQGIALDLWKKSLKANFIYQRDVLLSSHRGREFVVDSPRYAGTVRMYLTAQRLYVVAFFREQGTRDEGESEKFLDSFEIDEPVREIVGGG